MAAVLVWLDRDLRLRDNPALALAMARRAAVVPVFVWSPEEEAPWAPGAASRWWLHHSLAALDASLRARGSRLVLRRGPAAETLLSVAGECGASTVFWNRRYEPAALARDAAVERALAAAGIQPVSCAGNVLFEPGAILSAAGECYQVFTAFWRACVAHGGPAAPLRAPRQFIAPRKWPASAPAASLELLPRVDWAAGLRAAWTPGEAGAARLLHSFLRSRIEGYAGLRDRPDLAGTSRLSPHLHFGEIGVRRLWRAAGGAEPFLRQLAWREFSYHLLFHFPRTPFEPLRPAFARFPWRRDARAFRAWTRGRTGYPLVDAGMRELWHTGWMHNRVRMVAASFLVKHLLIPWQQGAAWFWDTLVDADLANNTMGWQWSAGCGADAAPYFRIFNPMTQAKKFDPAGDYVGRWAPELQGESPHPIVDHAAARARALAAFRGMAGGMRYL